MPRFEVLPMQQDSNSSLLSTMLVGKRFRPGSRRLTRAHMAFALRPELCAQLAETLAAAAGALSAELGCPVQATAHVLEAIAVPARALAQQGAFALIELSALGAIAVLELELPFLLAVVGRLSGARETKKGPSRLTRIEQAASAYLLLAAIQAFRGNPFVADRLSPRLLGVTVSRQEALEQISFDELHLPVEVRLNVADAVGVGRLLLPARLLQSAAQSIPPRPPATEAALCPEVAAAGFGCRRFIGGTQLSRADIDQLARGDVVLLEGLRIENGRLHGGGRVEGPTFSLHGEFQSEGFASTQLRARTQPTEKLMSDEYEDAASLPIDVEIELTRVRISLAELATLRPGQLLPLQINVSELVTVRVGDRAVAKAELVQIEGEVGARIVSLLPAGVVS